MQSQSFSAKVKAKALLTLATWGAGGFMLASCGGTSTNPLEGYRDVSAKARPMKDLPPKPQPTPAPQAQPEQADSPAPEAAVVEGLFPFPNTNGEVLNFTEGQEKSYALDIPVMLTGATFTVGGESLPQGATLNHVDGSKYELKWTPGNIVPQDKKFVSVRIKVVLNATGFSDAKSLEAYQRAARSHELALNVVPAQSKLPLIQNVKIASTTISEGDNVAIAVTVLDPAAGGSSVPKLQAFDGESGAGVKAARFVKFQSKPESLGGGRFLFNGKLSAAQISAPAAGSVVAQFALKATSPASKEASPISDLAIKVLSKKTGSKQ